MIDSRELRIGNWVYHCPLGTDAKVWTLVKVIKPDKINEDAMFLELIEPIPLTPEILIACGFEREERGDSKDFDGVEIVYFFKGVDIYDHRENGGGFSYATYTRYPNRGFKAGVSVESLHHLQNLIFALTQTEITINLK